MDIHKPKPWRDWSELLKEIGTIVIGVLIALGAEQAVESVHWSYKVDDARQRLKAELMADNHFALERDMVDSCLDRRLVELRTQLLGGSGQWSPLPPMPHSTFGDRAYVVPVRDWSTQVWTAITTDGTVTHLSPDLEDHYGRVYTKTAAITATNNLEFGEAGALNALNSATDLPRSERLRLAALVEQERLRNRLVVLEARQLMYQIGKLGAQDQAKSLNWVLRVSHVYRACAALNLLPPGSPPPAAAADSIAPDH